MVLNDVTYLVIPSQRGDCTGRFCNDELDHIFEIKNNQITYLLTEGWQLCDINNDGHIDQIVYGDGPTFTNYYLNRLKKEGKDIKNLHLEAFADIEIWTYTNGDWAPLKDRNNKPYFIVLGFDKMLHGNTYKLLDYNWVQKVLSR